MALIDRDAERRLAEEETRGFLRGRGLASEGEIGQSAGIASASRRRFTAGIPRLAESLSAQTGLADSGAASAAITPFAEDLQRTDAEANDLRRIREKRDNVNKVFNFMSARLANSGLDRTQAENVARQFALDEQERGSLSDQNERARVLAKRKQDLLDAYANRSAEIAREAQDAQKKGMFKRAIYQSLFGLAGAGIVAYFGGPAGAVAGNKAGKVVGKQEGEDNSLMSGNVAYKGNLS